MKYFLIALMCVAVSCFADDQAEKAKNLVRNGSFENTIPDWKLIPIEASASMSLDAARSEKKPNALKVSVEGLADNDIACVMLESGGKGTIRVEKNAAYRLIFWAKGEKMDSFGVVIPKQEGNTLAEGKIDGISGKWKKFEITLKPTEDYAKARLCFCIRQKGTLWLDDVSLIRAEEQ